MSKPKFSLTENGVCLLYDVCHKGIITMQVIFVEVSQELCYLRLSDGKHVSPVVVLVIGHPPRKFGVGGIIAVKATQLESLDFKRRATSQKDIDLKDKDLFLLVITNYTIVADKSEVDCILGSINILSSYKDAIRHIVPILKKFDPKFKYIDKNYGKAQLEAGKIREKGNKCFHENDYESALAHYDTAKGNDPYDYRLWSNSSRALFHLQEYEEAEEQAIVAIKVNPFQEKAYFRAGQAALKQGKYADAKEFGLRGRFLCGDAKDLQILIDEAESKLSEIKGGKARNNKNKKGSRILFNGSFNDEENVDPNVKGSLEEDLKNIMTEETKKQSKEKEKQSKKGKTAIDENCKEQKKIKEERPAEEDMRKQEATIEISSRSRNLYHETLKDARRYYETNQFRYALEVFGKALAYATPSGDSTAKNGYSGCQDFLEMQFLVGACMIHTNNNILDGMDMMKFFSLENDAFGAHASAHYFLGLAYEKLCLNRMAQAQSYECSLVLNNQKHKAFKWPGSDDIFPESDPERLKVIGDELYRRNKNHFDEDKSVSVWKSLPIEPTVIQKVDNITDFVGRYTYMEMVIQNSIEKTKREFLGMFSRGEHSRGYKIKVVRQRGDLIGRASTIKPTPKAKCRFKSCILTQGHPFAREEIFDTNPDFKGFVDVMCEEFCSVAYHPCCWKAHKEEQEDQFGKMSDKDFLGTECVTPDCTGKINGILIHDETGTLKHEILMNKRDKKNSLTPVKQKKKKDKKKTQPAKPQDVKDKKKSKHESLSEDFVHIEETATAPANAALAKPQSSPNDCQSNVKQKAQVPVPPLPIDPESLDKVAVVIKPTIEDDLLAPTKPSKKKKKNKKSKEVIQPDLLGDPLDTAESNKSEYVARLRILKQQREAQESDAQNLPRSTGNGFRLAYPPNISQWLDPENPFYLPQHLQDNPEELERILQTKMIASSSPNLDNSTITTLLEFVYEWLKAEGPMSINDDRLRQYVAENFPQDALNHVNHCGGIKQFLMQSIDFAMIDEVICVRDHVVRAQELIRKNVSERMMSSKFLISDGRKAKKFSHLLDDTKSSCSSSSSTSLFVGSGVSSHTSRTTSDSLNPVLKPLKLDSIRVSSTDLLSPKTKQKSQSVVDLDSFTTDLPKANLDHVRPKNKSTMEGLSDLDSFEIPSPALLKSPPKIVHSSKYSIHMVDDDYEVEDCEDVDGSDYDDDEAEDPVLNSVLQKAVDDGPVTITIGSQKQQTKPVKEKKEQTCKDLPSHLHHDEGDQCHSREGCQENEMDEEEEEEEELEEQEDFSDVEDESEEVIIKGEIEKMEENMRMLIEQNQKLNDKLIQVKSSTSIEISSLKQKVEEQKAEKRELESEKHCLAVARESEARKFKAEMCRMQEEVKSFQGRHTSLEHKYERAIDRINELDAKFIEEQEVSTQLREEVKNLQESLSSSSRRAHEAEVKYLCIKKDLAESHLNRTIDRLTEEVVRLRQLLQYASEDSIPDHATISRSIIAWDESIKSLRECKALFLEEAKRLLNMVNQGRPLNALPPGDLSVPAIPEMNTARLLSIVPNAKKLVQNCVHELPPERQYACGSPALLTSSTTQAFPLEPQMVSQKLPGPPGFESQKPLGLSKIVPALGAFSGGAIPKGTVASGSKVVVTETDAGATQKYPDSHKLFIGKLPWESTESDIKRLFSDLIGEVVGVTMYDKGFTPDGKAVPKYGFVTFRNAEDQEKALKYGPIMIGNHVINVQAKEARKPTKPLNLAVGGPSSAVIEPLIKSGPLAYGLSDISLNATSEANKSVVCTLSAPTVPKSITSTFTKPKFQNLTTTSSVGTIGTLPPKLVRPQPKQPTNGKGGVQSVTSAPAVGKEDTAAYKRLIEVCKQRIGKEYSSPDICSALREVRMKNSNSLSGMNVDHIVDSVKQRLRARRPASGQATVAPWAGLTQGTGGKSSGPEWQGLPSGEIPPEEQCSICLDALNLSPTLQLQCQHVFHEKCISGWLKRQSNCPNCRTYALMDDEYPSLKH